MKKGVLLASGSVSQRYGSEDLDPHPDPYQNVTDPERCFQNFSFDVEIDAKFICCTVLLHLSS
jgi:hypothetical protein